MQTTDPSQDIDAAAEAFLDLWQRNLALWATLSADAASNNTSTSHSSSANHTNNAGSAPQDSRCDPSSLPSLDAPCHE